MKKEIKSIKVLIIVLLLSAVCLDKVTGQKAMIVAVVGWTLFILMSFLFKRFNKSFKIIKSETGKKIQRRLKKPIKSNTEKDEPTDKSSQEGDKESNNTLLVHISCRITEKLKSAYPDTTWYFQNNDCLESLLNGLPVRIITSNTSIYTHAEVTIDQFASIHFDMLKVDTLKNAKKPTIKTKEEPKVVDLSVWYDLIANKILSDTITDLNARGHSKLFIRENGEVISLHGKNETVETRLDNLPEKNNWKELISIFNDNGLHAQTKDDKIMLSWAA